MRAFFRRHHEREEGQATIFVAGMVVVLFMMMGLAVVLGSYIVKYRQMQAAADMAALVGAQSLPCDTTDSTCITAAETDACTYATNNGFSGCTVGASSGSLAMVPPLSCSPYDFLDYDNYLNSDGTVHNSSCRTPYASAPSKYFFIEVRLQMAMTVPLPFFSSTVNLTTHAVARRGTPAPRDYALVVLNPTMSRSIYLQGSGNFVMNGSAITNSNATDAVYAPGPGNPIACDGGWFANGNETPVGSLPGTGSASFVRSDAGGIAQWTPTACTNPPSSTATLDNPVRFAPNAARVADPFASSSPPLTCTSTCTGSIAGCSICSQPGKYFQWNKSNGTCVDQTARSSGNWSIAGTNQVNLNGGNRCYELFPGVYAGGISFGTNSCPGNASTCPSGIFINPGIYSVGGGVTTNGQPQICIYGSPACDYLTGNNVPGTTVPCSGASFHSGDTNYMAPSTYYYYCSPYGVFDQTLYSAGGGCSNCAPTLVSLTGSGATSTAIKGVSFYLYAGSTSNNCCNVQMTGGAAAVIAAPNPCPGTGSSGPTSADFPAGSSGGSYTYPTTSLAYLDGRRTSPAGQLYPSMDFTQNGECTTNLGNVWANELGGASLYSHLHFLIFERNCNSSISLGGSTASTFIGTIYNGGAGCATGGYRVSIGGTSGSSGPPLFSGQIVADSVQFNGNSNVQLYYRPCRPGSIPCGLGPGTTLVE